MILQLRDYRIREGRLAEFVSSWSASIRPLRERHGFRIVAALTVPTEDRFVWVLGFDGDFAAADAAYYSSDERSSISPDPADLIVAATEEWVEEV